MDAYLLGRRDGALPTELLGTNDGNRIRAMAQLDGPEHNVFFAVEGPDEAAIESHFDAITGSGTTAGWKLVVKVIDEDDSLLSKIATGGVHPSHMPPWETYAVLQLELEKITQELVDAVEAARGHLGPKGVAVGSDGSGAMLIELGANDRAALDEAHAAIRDAAGAGVKAHTVAGSGFVKG
jgi:hypothetical protein